MDVFQMNRTRFPAKKRPQLRSLTEFARELGISVRILQGHLTQKLPSDPKPVLGKGVSNQAQYYVHAELQAWWKLINKKG